MKLIYIANARIPTEKAHGLSTMKMCEAFARAGLEVQLVVPWRFNRLKEDPFNYYDVEKNFKITKLSCLDSQPLDFVLGKTAFFIQFLSFLAAAKFYLAFKKYDILYTRDQYTGLFFKDLVVEIHFLPKKITWFYRRAWQRARGLVTLTSLTKEHLVKQGVPAEKITVAADGVDLDRFRGLIIKKDARQKVGLPLDKRIILYSGSFYLYSWKGIDVLLEAAKLFDDNYLFVLVGGSRQELEAIKKKYQLPNLRLVEHQSHRDIPYYLAAGDVLVLPNKQGDKMSEEQTSPLKLFEYMASRRPIVASDLPSIREVLNESNSVLVEPNNPEKLADGIRKVFRESELCDKIYQQAYVDVQNYTWANRGKKILKFLSFTQAKNK